MELYTYHGKHTDKNVDLIAGDFWLNVYGESLSVGSDLLTGTGITKYAVIKDMITFANNQKGEEYDYAIIDLPPSFGALVRAALYSSDYFLVPCTSDTYSSYCISLIGQMIPMFINDWKSGYQRFIESNLIYVDIKILENQNSQVGYIMDLTLKEAISLKLIISITKKFSRVLQKILSIIKKIGKKFFSTRRL